MPVLILAGDADRLARIDEAQAIFRAVESHGQLVLFSRAGHGDLFGSNRDLYDADGPGILSPGFRRSKGEEGTSGRCQRRKAGSVEPRFVRRRRPSFESDPMLTILRTRFRCQPAIEGIAISLPLALIDVHSKRGDWYDPLLAYLVAGFVLGLRHAGRAWQAWIPLGYSFYLMHRAAIACGYQPPYVEMDAASAVSSLIVSWPAGLGLLLGAICIFSLSVYPAGESPGDSGSARKRSPGKLHNFGVGAEPHHHGQPRL